MLVYDRRFSGRNVHVQINRRIAKARLFLVTHDIQVASRPLTPLQAGHHWPEDGDRTAPITYRSTGALQARREATVETLREPWGVRRQPGNNIISSYLDPAGMHGLLSELREAPELWAFDDLAIVAGLCVPHVNNDAEAFAIQRERIAAHWRNLEALCGHVGDVITEISRDTKQRQRLADWQSQQSEG